MNGLSLSPWKIIGIGFVLVLLGFVLPFLMMVRLIPSTLLLNLLAYGASVTGLFLGLIGAAMYVRIRRS